MAKMEMDCNLKKIYSCILGFHVTSPNSRIQNWGAYKIFTFIQGKIT